jgi:hypothetical protein
MIWLKNCSELNTNHLINKRYTVCETKYCGIIDQSLFYIDLIVHYIQNFENLA